MLGAKLRRNKSGGDAAASKPPTLAERIKSQQAAEASGLVAGAQPSAQQERAEMREVEKSLGEDSKGAALKEKAGKERAAVPRGVAFGLVGEKPEAGLPDPGKPVVAEAEVLAKAAAGTEAEAETETEATAETVAEKKADPRAFAVAVAAPEASVGAEAVDVAGVAVDVEAFEPHTLMMLSALAADATPRTPSDARSGKADARKVMLGAALRAQNEARQWHEGHRRRHRKKRAKGPASATEPSAEAEARFEAVRAPEALPAAAECELAPPTQLLAESGGRASARGSETSSDPSSGAPAARAGGGAMVELPSGSALGSLSLLLANPAGWRAAATKMTALQKLQAEAQQAQAKVLAAHQAAREALQAASARARAAEPPYGAEGEDDELIA